MKADTGAWWAAALLVAAARWPAAAAAAAAARDHMPQRCDSLACDSLDRPIPFHEYRLDGEDLLENITRLLGLNISNLAQIVDPYNELLDLLDMLQKYGDPSTNYRSKFFTYEKFIPWREYPKFKSSKPLPPRDGDARAGVARAGALRAAAPYVLEAVAPREPDFVHQVVSEIFEISKYKVRVNPTGYYCMVALLSGPVTFILALVTTASLLIVAVWEALKQTVNSKFRRPFDRKCDPYIKIILAIALVTLLSLHLYGMWELSAAEKLMEVGVVDMSLAICNLTRSVNAFLQNRTGIEPIRRASPSEPLPEPPLPWRDYRSFVLHWLYYNKETMSTLLDRRRTPLTSLADIARQLDVVHRDLTDVREHGNSLGFLTNQLNAELRNVKRTLLQTLARCEAPACLELQWKHYVQDFNTDVPQMQMPDMSKVLQNLTELREQRLRADVDAGLRVLRRVGDHYAKARFKYYNKSLETSWKLGHTYLRNYWFWIQGIYDKLENFEKYRELLTNNHRPRLPVLLLFGLPHGFWGERPTTHPGYRLRSKAVGAQWIYAVMVLTIAVFVVCALTTALVFFLGLLMQRALCDPLEDPLGSWVLRLADPYVDIEQAIFRRQADARSPLKLSKIIHQIMNPTATHRRYYYQVFEIDRWTSEDKTHFPLFKQWMQSLKEMQSKTGLVLPSGVSALSARARRNLRRLADTRFWDLPLDRIPHALKNSKDLFTKKSREMALLSDALERAAASVTASGGSGSIPAELRAAAAALQDLRLNIVLPMFQRAHALNSAAGRLQESHRFNVSHTSLKQAIIENLGDVVELDRFINVQANINEGMSLRQTARDLAGLVLSVYPNHITRCLPDGDFLLEHSERVRRTLCGNVMVPTHGMWLSLAWCCLQLLPILLVSRALARLFLHTDLYPGEALVSAYDQLKCYEREALRHSGVKRDHGLCGNCARACNLHRPHTCLPS
ncbi:uncharacterized protein LOC128673726 isoform X3 [Plodia interpunctella]|uniref:uncharacterized protein LOC128673726 isoform X3 n=1 Tax=Plodia interpunctella TaxID=58824 RepID=UPI0023688900|nr:uncharacterized protein LOC128673726 isoform X3 [Plodia interpunctella]